jgi:BNR/Asp-box repeat protein
MTAWPAARRLRGVAAAAVLSFAALGPSALPQEGGQVVTSLTLFAGTSGGLWRSTNWGGKWDRVLGKSSGESIAEVGAVYGVLPLGRNVYLAAEKGLFLSDDFGETWKKLGLDRPARYVLPSRYPNADPTVFAGTVDGLFKSTDAGRTFAPTVVRGTPVTRIEWPGPALVVTTGHGVILSSDGGASFSSGTGLPPGPPRALAVSSFFARDPVLFTAVGGTGVYRSGDGGQTWLPAGLDGVRVRDLVWLGPILFAATDQGLFRSDNGGQKWTVMTGLAAQPAKLIIFPLAPDSGLEAFLATVDGIAHTADGGAHWKAAGAPEDEVLCLATFPPWQRGEMRKNK